MIIPQTYHSQVKTSPYAFSLTIRTSGAQKIPYIEQNHPSFKSPVEREYQKSIHRCEQQNSPDIVYCTSETILYSMTIYLNQVCKYVYGWKTRMDRWMVEMGVRGGVKHVKQVRGRRCGTISFVPMGPVYCSIHVLILSSFY